MDLCKRTREDYILRMKEIQTDHNNVVEDTKIVINTLKTKYDTVFTEFRQEINQDKSDRETFYEGIKDELANSFKGISKDLELKDEKIKQAVGMLEAHKSYAFDLSKNMGAQMHQIVEA